MSYRFAVIGVGNMAKAIIAGIQSSDICIDEFALFDKNEEQYSDLAVGSRPYVRCQSIEQAVAAADCVLLSVKPQNYPEVLAQISKVPNCAEKLYVTIAAGITADCVSDALCGAPVVRVLPNLPMTVGMGVSVICKNPAVSASNFELVCEIFASAGSNLIIDEQEMNRIIGVTSSSPAYVFKFIDSIYKGALAQGLDTEGLLDAICDVFIGSAMLLKSSRQAPEQLIARVASKGGTTEQALKVLEMCDIDKTVCDAMIACTNRADELGTQK